MNRASHHRTRTPAEGAQVGSSLILALFVLAVVASFGLALLFATGDEMKTGKSSWRPSRAFHLAETGLESGRATLFASSGTLELETELLEHAGVNGQIDFDPATITPVYDSSGSLTGFTGYGDDVPVRGATPLDDGWFAVFLTNDPAEGATTMTDANRQVMLTGVGVGPERSVEIVQAIVEPDPISRPTRRSRS